jgi:hypothetical protein
MPRWSVFERSSMRWGPLRRVEDSRAPATLVTSASHGEVQNRLQRPLALVSLIVDTLQE